MIETHPELIIGVSGIRGIVGTSFQAADALRFGEVFGSNLGSGRVVLVSRDGRVSGWMLGHAVTAGLLAAGCRVLDLGVLPTPTVGVAVRTLQADGAVQVTASHNPAPWNGLKLFGPDGAVLSAEAGNAVRLRFLQGNCSRANWERLHRPESASDMAAEHVRLALALANREAIARQRWRVFLDGNGGSGGPVGTRLLQALGCTVVPWNTEADGQFRHEAEPIPAHLGEVAAQVRQAGVALGCVLDPDSDRLALIDERGECVSEEATVALAVNYRLRREAGTVVINMSTSRMTEDLVREAGGVVLRSAVGEANVVQMMRDTGAIIGGEGSGGVIDPRVGWVRDPFVGMAMILSLMAEEQRPLSELVAGLPRYFLKKAKFPVVADRLSQVISEFERHWPQGTVDRRDGWRLDMPDWWLHIRPSNTEPVVRVIMEGRDASFVEQLSREAETILRRVAEAGP